MNEIIKKKSVERFENFLKKINSNYKIIYLDKTARSAKEAAYSLNVEVGSILKSLIFKTDKNLYILCLVSGDRLVSIEKLSNILNYRITKANADEIKSITGFSIGGIPPFAHINKIETLIDESLSRFKNLYAAAGHPHCIFKTSYSDICNITSGKILDITS